MPKSHLLKKNTLINNFLIPFTLALTGAAVLIIEITANRIVSPYFGNTIFTFSAIISTVLAALSFGYYFGGQLSDKHPKLSLFYSIILFSGFLTFLILPLKYYLLPYLGKTLDPFQGPLITSLFLFFPASFVLGTLSPFGIKLQHQLTPKTGLGTISGRIFFFSTMGSIFGSLATGFYLIPTFTIDQIISATAVAISVLGFIPLIFIKKNSKITFSLFPLVALIIATQPPTKHPSIIYTKEGLYQNITIQQLEYNHRPTLFFRQDSNFSSAMYLDNPSDHVFDYSPYYQLHLITNPNPKSSLIVGAGSYTLPKALLETTSSHIDVVDIDPLLYQLSQQYFQLPSSPRLSNHVADGRRFLTNTTTNYDLIFLDAYSNYLSIPSHLSTLEFFQLTKSKLSPNGLVIANVIGTLESSKRSFLLSEIKTFSQVFPYHLIIATEDLNPQTLQNFIFVGFQSPQDIDQTIQIYPDLKIFSTLNDLTVSTSNFDFTNHTLLTDNYAPVDYLSSSLVFKSK